MSISGIALSLIVMLASVAIVQGFKSEIQNKIIGFGSHIQIMQHGLQNTFENHPITIDTLLTDTLKKLEGINHVQVFANKPAILRTGDEIEGAIFKGMAGDFNRDYFRTHLIEGKIPEHDPDEVSNEIVISAYLADRLELKTGDDIIIYFIDDPPRALRPEIAAIYSTGVREIDKRFILGDIRHIQRINVWNEQEVGGYEISLSSFDKIDETNREIRKIIPFDLTTRTITQIYPQIFEWLGLIDMNVFIILVLMITVGAINMITALLIMILERTSMIGLFKAIGATNGQIRRIFVLNASVIIMKGMIIGNLVALGFLYLQDRYQLISLDAESYYVSYVPVEIYAWQIIVLNAGTLILCTLSMYLPSLVVTRIQPSKALRFE